MIMAMDSNKLIGSAGGLPWRISSDLQYFKRVTMGKPVIMGRITFESIGKPLPGRTSIVVTRDRRWKYPGVVVVPSLQEGYRVAREEHAEEAMVIGGASLCQHAMPLTERLYLTVIEHEFAGDTWLDSFDWEDWSVVSEDPQDERDQGGYQFCYYVLDRRKAVST
jgi:dihydrofolate reductase